MKRQDIWQAINAKQDVPVLILGGGVDGLGLYRDLALQGVQSILIDKADFAAGASSKSSRMIHGGLRYLENREFGLVSEAVRERNRLLENAPHFVTPLKTTIPVFSWLQGTIRSALHFFGLPVAPKGRGMFIVKVGLMFYDFLTGRKRRIPKHFTMWKKKSLKTIPSLNPAIIGTATYWDAQVSQIERLCIEILQEAEEANPQCHGLNYASIQKVDGDTVEIRDHCTGETAVLRPKLVVNATGAWVDFANAQLGFKTQYMGGTKGSHLVIDNPALYEALDDRMVFYEHTDGRVCIAFRFMDKVIMGSTDIRLEDPDDAVCTDDEIEYMLTTLKGVFPDIAIARDQIVFKFCGVRPLGFAGDSVTGTISRGHRVACDEPEGGPAFPVLSMIGGKLSTFRSFAEVTCDKVLERLSLARKVSTEAMPFKGAVNYPETPEEKAQWIARAVEQYHVSGEQADRLLFRYGTLAEAILKPLNGKALTPMTALPEYTQEEIRHIIAHERVVHLNDLVCRRSVLAIRGLASKAVLSELAELAAPILDWDDARKAEEVQATLEAVKV